MKFEWFYTKKNQFFNSEHTRKVMNFELNINKEY